jgi:sugar phosphate permease
MWTPGIIGLVIGLLLLFAIKDDPETTGYPPIDEPAKSEQQCTAQHNQTLRPTSL